MSMSNKFIDAKLKSLARELDAATKKAVVDKISAEKSFLASQPPGVIVEKVKKGEMAPPSLGSWEDAELRQRLLDAGLLTAIGSFLNEGAHNEFKSPLGNGVFITGTHNVKTGEQEQVGFERISPKIWLLSLTKYVKIPTAVSSLDDKECAKLCLEVALNIGPFVECMCDDITREMFKSKKYYYSMLSLFFNLIFRLLASLSTETAEVLLEYDGFIDFIVQSLFWRTHRPDIIRELKFHSALSDLKQIEGCARCIIDSIIGCSTKQVMENGYEKNYDDEVKDIYKVFATAPIVSRAFDPDNDKIFLSNIATLMKADSF